MTFTIRRPMLNDAEEVVSLSKRISDRYFEELDEWEKASENQDNLRRYFVVNSNNYPNIIGYAGVRPDIPRQPGLGLFRIQLGVDPKWRNQGIGHGLIDAVSHELQEINAATMRVRIVENNEILRFFLKMGFSEYEQMIRLKANVVNIDTNLLDSQIIEHKSRGITISTLEEELRENSDCFIKLYELEKELVASLPNTNPVVPMSYEAFLNKLTHIRDVYKGYFIAKDGTNYIGCCYITKKEADKHGLGQGLTGVLSIYQKRGIASTLKYCTIQYAKQNGFHYIETASLSNNIKMLAVQRKVGFRIEESEIRLEKKI